MDLWLDARGPLPQTLVDDVVAAARTAAEAEGCSLEVRAESVSEAVTLDAELADTLAAAVRAGRLPTAAGHDAGVLAAHVPAGMLHVRNPTGVSHAPDEHAEDTDVETGARALADVLEVLCRQ